MAKEIDDRRANRVWRATLFTRGLPVLLFGPRHASTASGNLQCQILLRAIALAGFLVHEGEGFGRFFAGTLGLHTPKLIRRMADESPATYSEVVMPVTSYPPFTR